MVQSRAFLVAASVAAMALVGCVAEEDASSLDDAPGTTDPPQEDKGRITGIVIDDGLNPVKGATVALLDVEEALETTTDKEGAFTLDRLAPGSYNVAAQKLGYETAVQKVDVAPGQAAEVRLTLEPVPVSSEAYHKLLIGEGYFSCGAYVGYGVGEVRWGNLHACVWDEHKPRYPFEAPKKDLKGIMQEVVWEQNTALTAETLAVFLEYKTVCDPLCGAEESFDPTEGEQVSENPVRAYYDLEEELEKFEEDPVPLASLTFPDGENPGVVIVFQQRMTHYVTQFFGEHGKLDGYSAIPE